MKNWENLKLYKGGKKVSIPDDFVAFEHGGDYFFNIWARFRDVKDYVYYVLKRINPNTKMSDFKF